MSGAFYIAGSRHVFANLERAFVALSACVVAVPWLLVAIAIGMRRTGTALLMAMSCSIVYLLCIGWLAIAFFVLSWDKGALETIPVWMAGVQVVALIAAIA